MTKQYGFLTNFTCTEDQARSTIDFMVDILGIHDFQFYDAFYTYSKPFPPGVPWWETKTSTYLDNSTKHFVYVTVLRAYIDQIKKRGGRSWLYVQSIGSDDDDNDVPLAFQRLSYTHNVCGRPLFTCYKPNELWAQRMCDVWVPYALYMGFDGVHWDSLGQCNGTLGDGSIFGAFLRHTKKILSSFGLLQTFNFVDGFGWDPSLVMDGTLEFAYWEVWTLPTHEDAFFEEMARLNLTNERSGVFVCYPHGSHNPPGIHPADLANARQAKCSRLGCRYLLYGDGNRMIKNEYFPNAEIWGCAPTWLQNILT